MSWETVKRSRAARRVHEKRARARPVKGPYRYRGGAWRDRFGRIVSWEQVKRGRAAKKGAKTKRIKRDLQRIADSIPAFLEFQRTPLFISFSEMETTWLGVYRILDDVRSIKDLRCKGAVKVACAYYVPDTGFEGWGNLSYSATFDIAIEQAMTKAMESWEGQGMTASTAPENVVTELVIEEV